MMRAYTTVGDGVEGLKRGELPVPEPKDDEVLVSMRAASLNYRDLLVVNGVGRWKPPAPRVPLSDGAGVVVAAGGRVSLWKVGDRVTGVFMPRWLDGELTAEKDSSPLGGAAADGVLADYVAFGEQAVVRTPDGLSDAEAATLPVAAVTAWHAVVRRSRVREGETVLIQGTGGVSLFALQFVSALGGRAIVTSSSEEKLDVARGLGAWAAVNYKKFPDWDEQVLELTGGEGVDHVIEVVGGENLNRSLKAVRLSGTISFIGLLAGMSAPVDTFHFVAKNVRLHGIETGSREMFEEMNRFVESRGLRPVIDSAFSFEEVGTAMTRLESGKHVGKIVIEF